MAQHLEHENGKTKQTSSLPNGDSDTMSAKRRTKLSTREWLASRFNFSWFACTQSTGGIAILLSECPKQFDGLQTIAVIIFIFNIVLWLSFVGLLLARWISAPSTFRKSLVEGPECFFFGSFWLSAATIIICMQRFGVSHCGPWLLVTIRVCFWIYAACVLLSTTVQFVAISRFTPIKAIKLSPATFLIVLQAMLTGTVAAAIAPDQPPSQRMPILVAGIAYQGYGWMASFLLLAWFTGSLLEQGWPAPSGAPGLFMPIGVIGYTIVALIGAARAIPSNYYFTATHPTAPEVLLIMATWTSIFLWLLGLWLFGIALFVCICSIFQKEGDKLKLAMSFNNAWWAIIFPNVGFTLGTVYIGQELESNSILWVTVAMTILVIAFWLIDLILMFKAIFKSLLVDSERKLL